MNLDPHIDGTPRNGSRFGGWTSLAVALAVALGSCSVETEPGPGLNDAGVSGAGSGGGGDAASDGGGDGGAGDAGGDDAGNGGGSGGRAGMGGAGAGEGGGGDGGPTCDETRSPKDEPCLIDDDYAVFVSRDGEDDAEGTMAEPLASLNAAVAKAVESGVGRVIVCGGVYPQVLILSDSVALHGGFECDEVPWVYGAEAATSVAPQSAGEALRIEDVEERVTIEDMQFVARDAASAGGSSIAAIVRDAEDVVLRGVLLRAGAGADGAAGVTEPFMFPDTGGAGDECADPTMMCLAGKPADGNNGGADRMYNCPAEDVSVGGLGGDNASSPTAGQPGTPDLGLGAGGDGATSPGTCEPGQGGSIGAPGGVGTGGSAGSVSGAQWQPAAGSSGMPGNVGQGGGGGGALAPAGGGGGGGAGGCGGASGKGGQGGGASIALLTVSSSVQLEDCALEAGAGGDGGSGSDGQAGMSSGGIAGNGASGACPGGPGGAGGKGGAGGGGAGGISAGLISTGTEPVHDGTVFDLGAPGRGGSGGDTTVTEDDGVNGSAVEVLAM